MDEEESNSNQDQDMVVEVLAEDGNEETNRQEEEEEHKVEVDDGEDKDDDGARPNKKFNNGANFTIGGAGAGSSSSSSTNFLSNILMSPMSPPASGSSAFMPPTGPPSSTGARRKTSFAPPPAMNPPMFSSPSFSFPNMNFFPSSVRFGAPPTSMSSTPLVSLSASPSPPPSSRYNLLSLPPEIHAKILMLLDPTDVLSYARTCSQCNKYADTSQIWKHQWSKFSRKTPFTFLPTSYMAELGVNFKDSCRRLWKIMLTEGTFGGLLPTKCVNCKEYTCPSSCEEETPLKVSVDIGGKITWTITPDHRLRKHLSMIAVPKVLKCYDCDTTLKRDELSCDCVPTPPDRNPSLTRGAYHGQRMQREAYCLNRHMSSHTALEYCSQPLSDMWSQPVLSQPFCLFCEEDRVNRMLCEKEMVSTTKHKMKSVRPPYMSGEEEFHAYNAVSPLANGYCHDTASILGASNLDLLSPLLALGHEDAFPVVRAFLTHLFRQYQLADDLQKPNLSLVMAYAKMTAGVREVLLKFFFEEMKISRLCLLPKALAVSYLFENRTCIVIDSGATATFVWVVLDGRVDEERTQSLSVGGWQLSQLLKQSMSFRGENKDAQGATISSMDTSTVKQKCRLSLNPGREGLTVPAASAYSSCSSSPSSDAGGCFGQLRPPCGLPNTHHHQHHRQGAAGGGWSGAAETLLIKTMQDAHRRLELTEVTMSSELLVAPEMMYGSLDLPGMIKEATRDLPDDFVKDCFSHILLTGGNTDLQGFRQRLSSDLRALLPEHAPIINVCLFPSGNHSWNTAIGANTVKVPPRYDDIFTLHEPGYPLWISREEYTIFGSHQLAAESQEMEEREG